MKPFIKALVFVLVLFCFASFARAQAADITNGTFNFTVSFPPNSSSAVWTIGGDRFFSNLQAPDSQIIAPVIKRAGTTVEPFTLTYTPRSSARGSVQNNGLQWGSVFYRSDNHSTATTFNFNFPAHALPKFTPNRNDVFIDVPFTMDGNVAIFSTSSSTAMIFNRAVTGRGTAHINYIRVPNSFRSRKSPNPDVWLAYVLFVFHTPNTTD
jgi:hypothetical protein